MSTNQSVSVEIPTHYNMQNVFPQTQISDFEMNWSPLNISHDEYPVYGGEEWCEVSEQLQAGNTSDIDMGNFTDNATNVNYTNFTSRIHCIPSIPRSTS